MAVYGHHQAPRGPWCFGEPVCSWWLTSDLSTLGAHIHYGAFQPLARKQRYQLFTNVLLCVTEIPRFVTLRLLVGPILWYISVRSHTHSVVPDLTPWGRTWADIDRPAHLCPMWCGVWWIVVRCGGWLCSCERTCAHVLDM